MAVEEEEDEEETDIEEPAEEGGGGEGRGTDMSPAVVATGTKEEGKDALPEDSRALGASMTNESGLGLNNGVTSESKGGVSSPPVKTSPGSVKPFTSSETTKSPATHPSPYNAELTHSSDESTAVEDEDGESPVATNIPATIGKV